MLDQPELPAATERMLVAATAPSAPPLPTDWIEHDGGECPVSDLARVRVQFRHDRDRSVAERSNASDGLPAHVFASCWVHDGNAADILFYQVVA